MKRASTDNTKPESKKKLRALATAHLKELKVLDCFAGSNVLWNDFALARYYGIEIIKGKGKNLHADNRRVIQSLDLSNFNVIDIDIYGNPINQIELIFQNQTLQKGTVIIFTLITGAFSRIPNALLEQFNLKKIAGKTPTLVSSLANTLFYAHLYKLGIKEVVYYEIKDNYTKNYGYFIV